ncbi:MAG: hypothetical protein QXQ93_09275 [Ignisphaera sp.]
MEKDVKAVLVYKVFVEGDKPLAEESNILFRDLCVRIFSQLMIHHVKRILMCF